MKVLITAGPTREYIDDVRYITNASSGLMGAALADAAAKKGHKVTVVMGPAQTTLPPKIRRIDVVSAKDMIDATLKELKEGYDILVSTAALADYTPSKKVPGKIRSGKSVTLKLKRTQKLIAEARARFPMVKIVAFKAEYGGTLKQRLKSGKKLLVCADYVVVNDISKGVFGSDMNEVYIVSDKVEHIPRTSKRNIAKEIVKRLFSASQNAGL